MATLYQATHQWSTRPDDERFSSLADLHAAVTGYRESAREHRLPYAALSVEHDAAGEMVLAGSNGARAMLTNWAFGQLAARAGAPAGYLRELPADLAARNLNHGLATRGNREEITRLYVHRNGGQVVRAFNGPDYCRIYDNDISARLMELEATGPWQPAPAAFDGSRGLYASDHDLWCFMVDNERRIFETKDGGLSRGFFVWNSEVGARRFGILKFYYEWVCGNHRVWGATEMEELTIVHRGSFAEHKARAALVGKLRQYAEASEAEDVRQIGEARTIILGDDRDAVLDRIFRLRIPVLSRKVISAAFDRAALPESRDRYGDPRTAWGFTGGLTEVARDLPHADERNALDRAAGKILGAVAGKLARIAA